MDGILQPAPLYKTPVAPSATALSIAELRAGLRAQAETTAMRSQLGFAEAITVQAVGAYWSRIVVGVVPFQPPCDTRFLPESLAAAAANPTSRIPAFKKSALQGVSARNGK
jgi:hypothetical protein